MQKKYLTFILIALFKYAVAQDNYEIQVYSSPTQTQYSTMFELHSNFTFNGQKNIIDGVYPSHHALHETIEITTGVTNNFEVGFYLFTNYTNKYGYQLVGTHIRPRVSVPNKWHWPVGVSFSAEIGVQKKEYASDTWSVELRPIIDKQFKKLYLAFNPTFGLGLAGNNYAPSFEPSAKISYGCSKIVQLGLEYYASLGQINNILMISKQNHALFLATDLDVNANWEINFAPGWGLTNATDSFVFKIILGRRINWKNQH